MEEKDPTPYVPPTPEKRRRSALEMVRRGLARMPDLRFAHTVDIKVRRDGDETWHGGDWLKYLPVAFPEIVERRRAWAPEGAGLPPGYSHHPALGTYAGRGHVVCRLVDGIEPNSARVVWQAVGRDADHALQLAWQHREGERLDGPVDVWDVDRDEGAPGFTHYPFPVAPQW